METLVLAFMGDDGPGLVHALAEVLSDHGGNWESSRMTSLGGVFAGVLVVTVDSDRAQALVEDFRALEGMLDVTVRTIGEPDRTIEDPRPLVVEVDGPDRPGIIELFTAAAARARINLRRFSTATRETPDGGRALHVTALISPPEEVDEHGLRSELRRLGAQIGVEVTLAAADPQVRPDVL